MWYFFRLTVLLSVPFSSPTLLFLTSLLELLKCPQLFMELATFLCPHSLPAYYRHPPPKASLSLVLQSLRLLYGSVHFLIRVLLHGLVWWRSGLACDGLLGGGRLWS